MGGDPNKTVNFQRTGAYPYTFVLVGPGTTPDKKKLYKLFS